MVPAIPTQPSPIAQPNANMRSVGIPITAAAWRSCAVAWRPKPVSVRVTNHQSAAKDNRQMPPEINWGWPMKIGPICTRPAMNGLVMVRKSGVQRNWAPARSATPRPNVPQTWASMGAFNSRRMMPKCAAGNREQNRYEWQRQHWIEAAKSPEPERREHGEHEKLTMRGVDNFHQAKN